MKNALYTIAALVIALVLYLTLWPVPIDPVAWEAPANPGYTGDFAPNDRLADVRLVPVMGDHGAEDIALDERGRIYTGTEEGNIIRFAPDGTDPEIWVNTKGRPLGLDFDAQGNLIVADSYLGLLSISPDKKIELLTNECEGLPILFADDLDIARDGKIYFSDASVKFGAEAHGGPGDASRYEVVEQGLTGRLLVYDPATQATTTLLDGLSFANGVALSENEDFVLVNETGRYKIRRFWLTGPRAGTNDIFFKEMPGFPDNIERGPDGLFWVSLVAPRSAELDGVSGSPFLRKLIWRLPEFLQPKIQPYLLIFALDENGTVRENLQDPNTKFEANTSVFVTRDFMYFGSLHAPEIAIWKRKQGIP